MGVAQVIDGHTLRLQVWERPGILTEACGTGAWARGLVCGAEAGLPHE